MSGLMLPFLIVLLAVSVLAVSNWRYAMLATIVVGFAQDPIRKIIAGQPVQMVVLCVLAMSLALLAAMVRHGGLTLEPMSGGNSTARNTLRLFVLLVVLQAIVALVRFHSIMVPAIGMLAYLTPIPALWLAYCYVRDLSDVRRFLLVYVVVGALINMSIIASGVGYDSALLTSIGGDLMIFDRVAGIVQAHSGLMRAPEIAAWHAATVACMAIVLRVTFPGPFVRLLTPGVVLFCVYAAMLTGRRKVLAISMLFAAIYFLGLRYFGRPSRRHGMAVTALMATLVTTGVVLMAPEPSNMSSYALRSSTVVTDAWDRLSTLGVSTIGWALQVGGPFGLGTGAGAQGTQHFASGTIAAGGAAEGGLGKITVELGLAGLFLAILSAWMVARQVRRAIALAARSDPRLLKLVIGLIAFVAANVPVFVGASQAYGDPFILILLSSMLGFVLAVPRILRIRAARAEHFTRMHQPGPLSAGQDHQLPLTRAVQVPPS